MLVAVTAVLIQMHRIDSLDLGKALGDLFDTPPVGLLVGVLFALVLTTMVTQAFEFEAIRMLEGYWGNRRFLQGPARGCIAWQRRRRDQLIEQRNDLRLRAFVKADLTGRGLVPPQKGYIVEIIRADLEGQTSALTKGWFGKRRARETEAFDWQPFAPADLMHQLEAVEATIDEYPASHRVMPTKLGNTLRAVEEVLPLGGEDDLEGAVIRRWSETSDAVQKEHDQYRTRLDMYCTLVFVFVALAVIGPLLLPHGHGYLRAAVVTLVAFLALALVSYRAAIASARGYTTVLKTIIVQPL